MDRGALRVAGGGLPGGAWGAVLFVVPLRARTARAQWRTARPCAVRAMRTIVRTAAAAHGPHMHGWAQMQPAHVHSSFGYSCTARFSDSPRAHTRVQVGYELVGHGHQRST